MDRSWLLWGCGSQDSQLLPKRSSGTRMVRGVKRLGSTKALLVHMVTNLGFDVEDVSICSRTSSPCPS